MWPLCLRARQRGQVKHAPCVVEARHLPREADILRLSHRVQQMSDVRQCSRVCVMGTHVLYERCRAPVISEQNHDEVRATKYEVHGAPPHITSSVVQRRECRDGWWARARPHSESPQKNLPSPSKMSARHPASSPFVLPLHHPPPPGCHRQPHRNCPAVLFETLSGRIS